jgi:RING finger protein 113A
MEEPQSVPELPTATFKKRAIKSKSTLRKRIESPPNAKSDADSTSSGDDESRQVKRRKKSGGLTAKSMAPETNSPSDEHGSGAVALPINSNDATKASNWFEERDGELNSKTTLGSARPRPSASAEQDGTYKGQAKYQSFIQKNPDAPSRQVGPVKSSTNVRTITVIDFAPDVCKDYKQTGFCGYGDSCKFLHAREDYKQGWELDRDWEIGTKGKKVQGKAVASANRASQNGNEDEEDDAQLESIPFACIICKKSYKHPIITKCGHYFCEACALQRYRKNPSCAACGAGTGGVFNVAKKLSKLLEKKKDRAKQRKEQAIAKGDEVSESESKHDNDD